MSAEVVLDVSHVTYGYSPDLPPALRGVSLQVRKGEFVALIGQNGAGKTTLAKHFNGLFQPATGSVKVGGLDTRGASVQSLTSVVGYCYQNPDHQIFSSTVYKEVAYGLTNLQIPPDQIQSRAEHALGLVGLSEKRNEYPFLLGRGERQKLAVASVLAMGSQILVVDEPTTGLDLQGVRSIMSLLRKWNQEDNRTIIIITHDINLVAEYVPRTVVMAQGQVVADGPTRQVLADAKALAQAHVKPPQITRVAQALHHLGVPPDVMTVEEMVSAVRSRLGNRPRPRAAGEVE